MSFKLKRMHKINELAESSYVALSRIISSYAKGFVESLGILPHLPLPVFEVVKGALYWHKSNQPGFKDSKVKTNLNRAFYFSLIAASVVALGLHVAGMGALSSAVLVGAGFFSASRTLSKAVRSTVNQEENYHHKIVNNIQKTLVTGLITTGILLISFYPALEYVGVICELVATGHLFMNSFPVLIQREPSTMKRVSSPVVLPRDVTIANTSTNNMVRFSQNLRNKPELVEEENASPMLKRRYSI